MTANLWHNEFILLPQGYFIIRVPHVSMLYIVLHLSDHYIIPTLQVNIQNFLQYTKKQCNIIDIITILVNQ